MKKIILAIGLIIVLLSVFIGVVLVNAVGTTSSSPSLTATVMTSGLNVQGRNWGVNVPVGLYIDLPPDYILPDVVHHLANVTPTGGGSMGGMPSAMGWRGRCTGSFQLTIPLDGISVGPHTLTGIQDVTVLSAGAQSLPLQATTTFTILVTPPVDDRTLGNPDFGLAEIKSEIKSIEDKLDGNADSLLNGADGLEVIKTDTLDHVARVDVDSDSQCWHNHNDYVITTYDDGIRHVNLTIRVCNLHSWHYKYGGDKHDDVLIKVHFPPSEPASEGYWEEWEQLDKITDDGMYTYQFDTDSWKIVGEVGSSQSSFRCDWNVTTLEPQYELESVASAASMNSKVQTSVVPGPVYPEDPENPVNPE